MALAQVIRNQLETVGEIESQILIRVWGSLSYDENHLDPIDLSTNVMFNVPWLLRNLLASADAGEPPPETGPALQLADEIGRSRAMQGVLVESVIRSWRTAEQVIEERLIGHAAELDGAELLASIRTLGRLISELTDRSVESYRRAQREVTSHYDRLSTDLVAQIVTGSNLTAEEVSARARAIQLDPDASYLAVAVGIAEQEDAAAHLHAQRHLLGHLGLRVSRRILIGSVDGRVLLLVPVDPGATGLVSTLLENAVHTYTAKPGLLLGLSSRFAPLVEAHETVRQARLALEVGRRLGRSGEVVSFASVALETLLIDDSSTANLLLESLRPILDRPELLDTLRAYFSAGLSAREAARKLFVHPNTVPHRLRTISRMLQRTLDDVREMSDLVLALRWLDLNEARN